jgi:hypothetical protein
MITTESLNVAIQTTKDLITALAGQLAVITQQLSELQAKLATEAGVLPGA